MLHVAPDHAVGQRCAHEAHIGHVDQAHFLFWCHDNVAKVQGAEVDARLVQLAHQRHELRQALLPAEARLARQLAKGLSRQRVVQHCRHSRRIQFVVLQNLQRGDSLFLQLRCIVDETLGVRAQQGR
ncbi:hypothetical protein D3C76_1314940 [compost metagenome]